MILIVNTSCPNQARYISFWVCFVNDGLGEYVVGDSEGDWHERGYQNLHGKQWLAAILMDDSENDVSGDEDE